MANTFSKLQRRIENSDGSYTFEPLSYVGVDGTPLDIMKGATGSNAGTMGLVPAPGKGDENKVLLGNGTWGTVTGSGVDTGIPSAGSDEKNWFLMGNKSWGYPWIGSSQVNGKTQIIIGSNEETLNTNNLPEATSEANGLMSATDKNILNAINVEAFHAYGGTTFGLGATPNNTVAKVDPSNSSNQYNSEYFILDNFKSYQDNTINGKKPFERINTDPNNKVGNFYCGLKTIIAGYYMFDCRIGYKLDKATGHRVEYGPFVNGERVARWFNTFTHMKSFTIVHTERCWLKLNVGDVVKFGYKIVDPLVEDFSDNQIQVLDTMCLLLRPL